MKVSYGGRRKDRAENKVEKNIQNVKNSESKIKSVSKKNTKVKSVKEEAESNG